LWDIPEKARHDFTSYTFAISKRNQQSFSKSVEEEEFI